MGRKQGPRKGSMQIWPRKRAEKFLPRVNWAPLTSPTSIQSAFPNSSQKTNLLGFIGYKAGMASAFVKDNTPDSMTKGKRIIVPVTILECPPMKILSVRFYKNGIVSKEVLNNNLEKEVKKIIKFSKNLKNPKELIEKINGFDDIRVIVYSQPKKTGIKKTPDVSEIGISGTKAEKLEFVKNNLDKEFSIAEIMQKGLVDVRGLTKGKGFQGSVKRFGIRLRFHKSEKGVRRVGSIGAWHPIGVRFTVPMPGQLGLFTRVHFNNLIVSSKKFAETDPVTKRLFDNYGFINTDYLILRGSIQGPQKRQLLITSPIRPIKRQAKKNYELIELR